MSMEMDIYTLYFMFRQEGHPPHEAWALAMFYTRT